MNNIQKQIDELRDWFIVCHESSSMISYDEQAYNDLNNDSKEFNKQLKSLLEQVAKEQKNVDDENAVVIMPSHPHLHLTSNAGIKSNTPLVTENLTFNKE